MCFEFVHRCDVALHKKIDAAAGMENYFMVCLHELNFMHLPGSPGIAEVKTVLAQNRIELKQITDKDMLFILDFPETIQYFSYHGSTILLQAFRESKQNNLPGVGLALNHHL